MQWRSSKILFLSPGRQVLWFLKVVRACLASVLLDASSFARQILRHALVRTRWKPTGREPFARTSLIPLLHRFCDSEPPQRAQATN